MNLFPVFFRACQVAPTRFFFCFTDVPLQAFRGRRKFSYCFFPSLKMRFILSALIAVAAWISVQAAPSGFSRRAVGASDIAVLSRLSSFVLRTRVLMTLF